MGRDYEMHIETPLKLNMLWCLQFYGRGLFGTPPVAWAGGPYRGVLGAARKAAFTLPLLLSAGLDQPLRTLSGSESWFH